MPQGIIKKIVADRGFGFISAEREDVFFHHSAVQDIAFDDLGEGQAVEYAIEEETGSQRRGRGPRASSVKPV